MCSAVGMGPSSVSRSTFFRDVAVSNTLEGSASKTIISQPPTHLGSEYRLAPGLPAKALLQSSASTKSLSLTPPGSGIDPSNDLQSLPVCGLTNLKKNFGIFSGGNLDKSTPANLGL